jgi:hypothetical protein
MEWIAERQKGGVAKKGIVRYLCFCVDCRHDVVARLADDGRTATK